MLKLQCFTKPRHLFHRKSGNIGKEIFVYELMYTCVEIFDMLRGIVDSAGES